MAKAVVARFFDDSEIGIKIASSITAETVYNSETYSSI